MAASHVLTLGYGNGTLAGSAALVLSLGYGIGDGGGFTPTETYCVNAAQAYTAGARKTGWYVAGADIAEAYTAGAKRTQGECC